jgi:hypothetical protein
MARLDARWDNFWQRGQIWYGFDQDGPTGGAEEVSSAFSVASIILAPVFGSVDASAVFRSTQAGSFDLAAVIQVAEEFSVSAGAVLKRTQAGTFTTAAVLKAAESSSFAISAVILKTITGYTETFTQKLVTAGATHLWGLGETGATAEDTIGAKDGTYTGASLTQGVDGPPAIAGSKGLVIPALDGHYVAFSDGSDMPSGSSDRTIVAWFKTTRTSSATVIGWGTSSNGQQFVFLFNYADDIGVSSYNNDIGVAVPGNEHYDGNWHCVVLSYTGSTDTFRVLLDGDYIGNASFGGTRATSTASMRIGALYYANGFYFGGTLSNIAILPSAVSDELGTYLSEGDSAIAFLTADAVISGTLEEAFSADAVISSISEAGGNFAVSALVTGTVNQSFGLSANITDSSTTYEYGFGTSSLVSKLQAGSFSASALLLGAQFGSVSASAAIVRTVSDDFDASALLLKTVLGLPRFEYGLLFYDDFNRVVESGLGGDWVLAWGDYQGYVPLGAVSVNGSYALVTYKQYAAYANYTIPISDEMATQIDFWMPPNAAQGEWTTYYYGDFSRTWWEVYVDDELSPSQLTVHVGYRPTELQNYQATTFTVSESTWYTAKIEQFGSHSGGGYSRIKVWKRGDAEPSEWLATASSTNPITAELWPVAIELDSATNDEGRFDNFWAYGIGPLPTTADALVKGTQTGSFGLSAYLIVLVTGTFAASAVLAGRISLSAIIGSTIAGSFGLSAFVRPGRFWVYSDGRFL